MFTTLRKSSMILIPAAVVSLVVLMSWVPARGDDPQSTSKTKKRNRSPPR